MANFLIALFAHYAVGIDLSPVSRCSVNFSYCWILCCNDERNCFSFKHSFFQPSPCFIISLMFSLSRSLPIQWHFFPSLVIFFSFPFFLETIGSPFLVFNSLPPTAFGIFYSLDQPKFSAIYSCLKDTAFYRDGAFSFLFSLKIASLYRILWLKGRFRC